ncbi:MAG: hypothetical protein ACR652_13625 [Methylocystis sp.]|uniref:hypothetical protein n=1 Tax=Methylocystis sp. TaxID=1911079 RepID=UPI003DA3CBAB
MSEPTSRERDFLLLTVYVLARQGYVARAAVLLEALHLASAPTAEVTLGRAILRFFKRDFSNALTCLEELDRIDPLERFGHYRLTERQRMRRYLKARCLFELNEVSRAREVLDVYMRHGDADTIDAE